MLVSLDKGGPESALEQVARAVVSTVEPLGVDAIDLPHSFGKVCSGCPDHKVVVVRHQAVREALPGESRQDLSQPIQEDVVIPLVEEDSLLRIPTGEHVVGAAGN